jgi:hypothetical protein
MGSFLEGTVQNTGTFSHLLGGQTVGRAAKEREGEEERGGKEYQEETKGKPFHALFCGVVDLELEVSDPELEWYRYKLNKNHQKKRVIKFF